MDVLSIAPGQLEHRLKNFAKSLDERYTKHGEKDFIINLFVIGEIWK